MSTKSLCVILARAGSKGIKRKNIIDLNGKPLVHYTIKAALDSGVFDDVVVSTDCKEIKKVAIASGAQVPFLRPENLSKDNTLSRDAVLHAIKESELAYSKKYNFIFELQCTSPIRDPNHIIECHNKLVNSDSIVDSVVSVVRLNHYHPEKIKVIKNGALESRFEEYKEKVIGRRQDMDPLYIRNGSIFAMKRKCIIDKFSRKGDVCLPFIMDEKHSVNIDTHIDVKLAEILMNE
jgi:CMP-N,N'-diacetyllegionaminic acid synthase